MEIQEAESRLQALELLVRTWPDAVLISTGMTDREATEYGEGVRTYENTSGILRLPDGSFVASFPTRGHAKLEIPGTLEDSVTLVERVYKHFRASSKSFVESVREIVRPADVAPRLAAPSVRSDSSIVGV